jgi:ParB family chromosome partitioning protein
MLRTDKNHFEISLIENLQRQDLNPIEEAEAYEKMIREYQYTHEMLAEAVGKARATISNILSLNQLPEALKKECSRANIPKRALVEIARLETDKQKMALFNKLKMQGLTSDDVREMTRKEKSKTIRSRREIFNTRVDGLSSYLTKIKLGAWSVEDRERAMTNLRALKNIIDNILAEQG